MTVTNTSFEPITTTSLVDNVYGDLNGRGSCATGIVLAANGGRYSCAFDGNFTGNAGDAQTDTVTVTAVDNDNSTVTAKASATVTLTPANVPPVFVTPVIQTVVPPAPVPQVLVRTGSNALRQARLAGLFLLAGMVLVAASWRFRGGPGLSPVPSGPGPRGGGPRRGPTGAARRSAVGARSGPDLRGGRGARSAAPAPSGPARAGPAGMTGLPTSPSGGARPPR